MAKRKLTAEQSRRRSEITQHAKPWLAARGRHTGPRTEAGKRRSRMNALKHGERDARARATRAFITNTRHMAQFIGALVAVEFDESPKLTYFLKHATRDDWLKTIARLKVGADLPDIDCDDPAAWTRWLAEHRAAMLPNGFAACRFWRNST